MKVIFELLLNITNVNFGCDKIRSLLKVKRHAFQY